LRKLEGFKAFTSPEPDRTGAVVTFVPGTLDMRKVVAALYEKEKIAVTTGGGAGRNGVRVSAHFYNTPEEIDRLLAALGKYSRTGV
jgi:selenocysteine lyase/cysteine desulfurase